VIWRRTAVAMIAAFVGFVAIRLFDDGWLRQRFLTPVSATWNSNAPGPQINRSWVLSWGPSDRAGHPFTGGYGALQSCARSVGNGFKDLDPQCLARHGAGYNHAVWQPAGRFWELQGIETALFVGVSLVLLAFTAWWLRRRTA